MASYVYPAVFTQEENGYFIDFPDFDSCYTQGKDLADGIHMAEDVLSLMLTHFEDEGREIPKASNINDLQRGEGVFATYIACDTVLYRRLMNNMAVKKTLSIPSWLNDSAMAAGLNFSQVLQEALKQQLSLGGAEGEQNKSSCFSRQNMV